jgi:hypothetical protein
MFAKVRNKAAGGPDARFRECAIKQFIPKGRCSVERWIYTRVILSDCFDPQSFPHSNGVHTNGDGNVNEKGLLRRTFLIWYGSCYRQIKSNELYVFPMFSVDVNDSNIFCTLDIPHARVKGKGRDVPHFAGVCSLTAESQLRVRILDEIRGLGTRSGGEWISQGQTAATALKERSDPNLMTLTEPRKLFACSSEYVQTILSLTTLVTEGKRIRND